MKSPNMLHVCGQCGHKFASEEEYLQHRCPSVSGQIFDSLNTFKMSQHDIVAAVTASRLSKKTK